MANHGSKFVSVNLNKSYGQQHQPSHHGRYPHFNSSYGQAAAGRSRGGSGGGMVVLSRNRGAPAKVVPKLSVPPPLNLPSLRKEHEKFDISGPGGPGTGSGTGSGVRPTSSGVGWTKPVAAGVAFSEKNETGVGAAGADGVDATDGASRGIGSYMPPSARTSGVGGVSSSETQAFMPLAERAVVLRGEDFPSLQAARPVSSGASQKQKEVLNQKQVSGEELTQDKTDRYHLGPLADTHPRGHSSKILGGSGLVENGGEGRAVGCGQSANRFHQKEENFPDPLPLVSVIPRSDWADDERDTGHGLMERGRDNGYSNPENFWDRDFDFPRPSVLPHKPAQNQYNRWDQRDNETGKSFSSEVLKMDPFNKDARASSREGREGGKWRTSTYSKDGFGSQEVGNCSVEATARMAGHNNLIKENRYTPPHSGDIGRDGNVPLNRDSGFGRRDLSLVGWQQQQQQQRNISTESSKNRGAERISWDLHATKQPNRPRGMDYQNNTLPKSSAATSGKMLSLTDPILTMGRDKRFSKSDRHFSEDPFLRDYGSADFDDKGDIFSGGLVGVIKRKKDAAKPTDFHDPVRESFEAELERVQKMQELERQRIIEEQERALEQARKEEEDRQKRIREEEECRRRVEEEAQEAAWQAEQERLEAMQRAEEQRIAREEEKKRIQLEEERRKQAARQKLQELEARMAKRHAEVSKGSGSLSNTIVDENPEPAMLEKYASRNLDLDTWEDSERMVENMTSGSFDSSTYSRSVKMSSKPFSPIEGPSNVVDRGKAINSWRRDVFENSGSFPSLLPDQDIGPYNPSRGSFGVSKAAYRKEFHGGAAPSRPYLKSGMQEPYMDEFGSERNHRWSFSGNADSYGKLREMDPEFSDNIAEKYGDRGWAQEYSHRNNHPPYSERLCPHSEANDLYTYGRSRYSMRQPRVLPPPLALSQRSGVIERTDPSTFEDSSIHYTHAARAEPTRQTAYYGGNQGGHEPSEIFGLEQESGTSEEQKLMNASRCDSQSSLSVSSPPTSPPHLSHDELDESGESPVTSAVGDGRRSLATSSVNHNGDSGNGAAPVASDSISAGEDEEWALENDDRMQQQEEYDEDENCYREEDEVREGDEENLELNQKFEGLELGEREPTHMMENVVLGFDEGVQVVIPSNGSEKNIGTQERSYVPAISSNVMEEKGLADGLPSTGQCVLSPDDSLGTGADICSGMAPEKSAVHGTIGQSASAPYSFATTDPLDTSDSSGAIGFTVQPTISPSGGVTSVSNHTNPPSSSSGNPDDLPVKLQFGLFSGPSLIPSPMPAIQIGSIQMPLHVPPPFGPSITHMHPSQASMFQFGQLRYTSPISQGILPMAPQSVSFAQPNTIGQFNLHNNAGGSATQESAKNTTNDEVPSISLNKQSSVISASPKQSNESLSQGLNAVVDAKSHEGSTAVGSSSFGGVNVGKMKSELSTQAEEKGHHHIVSKSNSTSSKARGSTQSTRQPVGGEKNLGGLRSVGQLSGGRGKRFAYVVKNANARPSFQGLDMQTDPNGFLRRPRRFVQRNEFRKNNDRKPAMLVSSNNTSLDDKSNNSMGKAVSHFTRSGSKRGAISYRSMKQGNEMEPSASGNSIPRDISGDSVSKEFSKNLTSRTQNTSYAGQLNLRTSEEDVDAPLQSGVVRVFKQPGIEAPSDEDDFIEVRSKRQMLNDRREQREKETKAKSRTTKPPRKPRSMRHKDKVLRSHDKLYVPAGSEELINSQLDFSKSENPHSANKEVSAEFGTAVSQPRIGTLAVSSEAQAIKPDLAGSVSALCNGKTECEPVQTFDIKDKVISLSQTQIADTVKPTQYDTHVSAVGGHSSKLSDPVMLTSSNFTKDKSFSSGASAINSLLAGQKIQFGAVTSPTVLAGSNVISNTIGSPTPTQSDVQVLHKFPIPEKDNTLFFEKEKHLTESRVTVQDSEAEAEAAASAVAAAAISSDEIVGNGLGSVNDTKSFGGVTGVVGDQHLASHSRGEDLLNVSLPADLSVETTPISLWPPLPSPQSSSSQMLSHFPGCPPSQFPFYEMNPMLGGPIFAFSPQEESSGTPQSQPQKSTALNSGSFGNWQQSHSGLDSFCGPPAGYSGPFIGPPRGIPNVQGPPHMVVYNHFAPVGQYGQVGLSFMGTTYIPSGKQTDWKNAPITTAMPIGEGDISNMKTANVHRNAPNMTAPPQRLAPGSSLLSIPTPMPLFDVSPFQGSPDLPVQAHWGHIPASPLHSVPVSRSLQPQVVNALPSQVNHVHPVDQSLPANRFPDSRIATSSDNGPSSSVGADKEVTSFPAGLGLVDPLRSTTSAPTVTLESSSVSTNPESGRTDTAENGKHQNANSLKSQFPQKNASPCQGNAAGYKYQRGGMSQRSNTGGEWPHRRMGFHGRNQGHPGSKMKQIYVAKQTTTGSSTT